MLDTVVSSVDSHLAGAARGPHNFPPEHDRQETACDRREFRTDKVTEHEQGVSGARMASSNNNNNVSEMSLGVTDKLETGKRRTESSCTEESGVETMSPPESSHGGSGSSLHSEMEWESETSDYPRSTPSPASAQPPVLSASSAVPSSAHAPSGGQDLASTSDDLASQPSDADSKSSLTSGSDDPPSFGNRKKNSTVASPASTKHAAAANAGSTADTANLTSDFHDKPRPVSSWDCGRPSVAVPLSSQPTTGSDDEPPAQAKRCPFNNLSSDDKVDENKKPTWSLYTEDIGYIEHRKKIEHGLNSKGPKICSGLESRRKTHPPMESSPPPQLSSSDKLEADLSAGKARRIDLANLQAVSVALKKLPAVTLKFLPAGDQAISSNGTNTVADKDFVGVAGACLRQCRVNVSNITAGGKLIGSKDLISTHELVAGPAGSQRRKRRASSHNVSSEPSSSEKKIKVEEDKVKDGCLAFSNTSSDLSSESSSDGCGDSRRLLSKSSQGSTSPSIDLVRDSCCIDSGSLAANATECSVHCSHASQGRRAAASGIAENNSLSGNLHKAPGDEFRLPQPPKLVKREPLSAIAIAKGQGGSDTKMAADLDDSKLEVEGHDAKRLAEDLKLELVKIDSMLAENISRAKSCHLDACKPLGVKIENTEADIKREKEDLLANCQRPQISAASAAGCVLPAVSSPGIQTISNHSSSSGGPPATASTISTTTITSNCRSGTSGGNTAAEPPNNLEEDKDLVQCKWRGCGQELEDVQLLDHLQSVHVAGGEDMEAAFACEDEDAEEDPEDIEGKVRCLWIGCKVYGAWSSSSTWLSKHVTSHVGNKPFKCIVEKCRHRFHTQLALNRHVNSHFKPPLTPGGHLAGGQNHNYHSQHHPPQRGRPPSLSCSCHTVTDIASTASGPSTANSSESSQPQQQRLTAVSPSCKQHGSTPTAASIHFYIRKTRRRKCGTKRGRRRLVAASDAARLRRHRFMHGVDPFDVGVMAGIRHALARVKRFPRRSRIQQLRRNVDVEEPTDAGDQKQSHPQQAPPAVDDSEIGFDSTGRCVVVYSRVKAKRVNSAGETFCLVSWIPAGLLNDEWLEASSVRTRRKVPLGELTGSAKLQVDEYVFGKRKDNQEKAPRKTLPYQGPPRLTL